MPENFTSLPPEILLSVFYLLDSWESLQALALVNHTASAVYSRYEPSISTKVLENVRRSYQPPHVSVRIKVTPSTVLDSELCTSNGSAFEDAHYSPQNILPVRVEFTATLDSSRPILLNLAQAPFSDYSGPESSYWGGKHKHGRECAQFADRQAFRPGSAYLGYPLPTEFPSGSVYLDEITPSGERTTLHPPIDPKLREQMICDDRLWSAVCAETKRLLFLTPGQPWVSQELDIPNFDCKTGCRYEVGMVGPKWDTWWCFGSEGDFSDVFGAEELEKHEQQVRKKMREDLRMFSAEDEEEGPRDARYNRRSLREMISFEVVESKGFEVRPSTVISDHGPEFNEY